MRTTDLTNTQHALRGISPGEAWDAIQRRDPGLDDRLRYAVTTTGVYCRPSCPARRPRPENVRFFPDSDSARAAGFRPCKRCRPDGEDRLGELIGRAQAYLREHLDDRVTLKDLGREVGVSPTHLQRTFKARVGMSPMEYVRAVRTMRVKRELRDGHGGVTRSGFDAGFGSTSAMYAAADAHLGMTPATYGAGAPCGKQPGTRGDGDAQGGARGRRLSLTEDRWWLRRVRRR
jgi:AraC family transcriptional regulator of adaptative response/methylated-DNA-[protein]-cysteine methyltransferase